MSYRGRELTSGNYLKLDDIQSQFNGSTTTFNLTSGGSAFYPGSVFSLLVSINGTVQEPNTDYTINQNTIIFVTAPQSAHNFFCIVLGVSLGIGVPGEGTVSGSKLTEPFDYNDGLLYLDSVNNRIGINSTVPTKALDVVGDARVTGVVTTSQFSTGASGTGININTNTISGPSLLYIDPAAVGDNTGAVRIKGDLYVDGAQTVINSTTIDLADFRIGIGTTATSDIVLDGAGIGIGSASNQKTLTWNDTSDSLKSSENFDVASGKTYKINGTSVLSNNTLGSSVVTSSLTSVGTLGSLSVGNINSTGIMTATYYYGNGSNLAGIATTKNLTVGTRTTAVSISVVGTGMTVSLRSGIGTVNF
jgi:hypothetical protein